MRPIIARYCLFALLAIIPFSLLHAETLNSALEAKMQSINEDDASKAAAIELGRERALLCKFCHGPDGNGGPDDTPILAGQNPTYLLHQIERFATGERKKYVMQKLAASFTDEDKINLAAYYSSIELVPSEHDPVLAAQGQAIFKTHCVYCHGDDGRGKQGYARIAGQKPDYIIFTLNNFKKDSNKRFSPEMQGIAKSLSEEEMKKVAHYVGSLR